MNIYLTCFVHPLVHSVCVSSSMQTRNFNVAYRILLAIKKLANNKHVFSVIERSRIIVSCIRKKLSRLVKHINQFYAETDIVSARYITRYINTGEIILMENALLHRSPDVLLIVLRYTRYTAILPERQKGSRAIGDIKCIKGTR